jgi:uncharacterized membrane protein
MSDRDKMRSMLVKARMYRLTAIIFALMGLIVFAVLYFQNMQGDLLNALRSPYFIVVVAFPFLPAAVLSWMAANAEKKLSALIETHKRST